MKFSHTLVVRLLLYELFAVLFFVMLLTLGVGSAMALLGAVITIVTDQFPHLKLWIVTSTACVLGFLIGLVYVTPGGQYIVTLVDFDVTFIVFTLACVETMAVAWIYGVNNICQDLEFMLGRRVGIYWRVCWGFVTPVLLVIILVYAIVMLEPLTYSGVVYPDKAYVAAYVVLAFGVLQCPLWIGYQMYKNRKLTFKQVVSVSFSPIESWGPRDPIINKEWREFKDSRRYKEVLPPTAS